MSTETVKKGSLLPELSDLLPELNTFLKKMGVGINETGRYKNSLKVMLEIITEKYAHLADIQSAGFEKEYLKANGKRRKYHLEAFKHFFYLKGLLKQDRSNTGEAASLEKIVEGFMKELTRRAYKNTTKKQYSYSLGCFLNFCDEKGIVGIDNINRKIVGDYLSHLFIALKNVHCLNKKRQMLYSLRVFFRYLFERGFTLFDFGIYVEVPREDKKISMNFFKREEIIKLFSIIDINTAAGFMDRTIFEILYGTGMRIGELCRLKVSDVDLQDATLFINQGKGGKDRVVPLTEIALRYLKIHLENVRPRIVEMILKRRIVKEQNIHENLFINFKGQEFLIESINNILKHYLLWAGIKRRLTSHGFRYSAATHMLENGADIRYIAELLGHSKLDTTSRYTKTASKILKEAISHHPREKEKVKKAIVFTGKARVYLDS